MIPKHITGQSNSNTPVKYACFIREYFEMTITQDGESWGRHNTVATLWKMPDLIYEISTMLILHTTRRF